MQEIEWFAKRQAPTFDKRKKPAIDGNIGSVLLLPLLGMGEEVTEEALRWLSSFPDIVMAPMEICRYTDDAISYEREMNAGQGPTTIVCYMMEHNLTKNEAAAKFESMANESWKKLNQACLRPTKVPAEVVNRLANFARASTPEYLLGFSHGSTIKELISMLFLNPFSI
ncbi:Alpha-humulene synthase [Rhynchospora pubera]|uniref:Alpha-humulene synthase n=1 Tax=Rhynchospora pubera TaxID=906938 RepID=A0AAV8DDG0_9POAL|nr:Alpha-humulene synthase [Rhynchospora pubera]